MDFNLSTRQLDQKAKVQYQSVYHDLVDMYFSIYIQRLLTRMNFPIPSAQRDSKTALLAGRSPAALKTNAIAGQLFPHRRFSQE
ncbi:MAG: hypothetical protein QOD95_158 [Gammaproteobacteria bacterium]|jgi:hypothetical protein|nr:hypothetical protein [Gammaproteobacteria bacterium]